MRTVLLCLLLSACAEGYIEPDADTDQPTAGSVGVISQALTCPGRPADRKLFSPSCPTCPVIWLYPYQSPISLAQIKRAAKFWNDTMRWNVVGVDDLGPPYRTTDNVPTYGVVIQRNGNYNMPDNHAGEFRSNHFGCSRDYIRISAREDMNIAYTEQVMMHEIGHALFNYLDNPTHQPSGDHSTSGASIMFGSFPFNSTNQHNVESHYQYNLNQLRAAVSNGGYLPCYLRGEGC